MLKLLTYLLSAVLLLTSCSFGDKAVKSSIPVESVYISGDDIFYFNTVYDNKDRLSGKSNLVKYDGKNEQYIRTVDKDCFISMYGDKEYLYYSYIQNTYEPQFYVVVERISLDNTDDRQELFSIPLTERPNTVDPFIYVIGNNIYVYDARTLYLYTQNELTVLAENVYAALIYDGYIYYEPRVDSIEIYRMDLDVSNSTVLVSIEDLLKEEVHKTNMIYMGDHGIFENFVIYDNKLYFLYTANGYHWNGLMYELDLESRELRGLSEKRWIESFTIYNDQIYFVEDDPNANESNYNKDCIYKMDLDGNNSEIVSDKVDNIYFRIYINDDKLYYYNGVYYRYGIQCIEI